MGTKGEQTIWLYHFTDIGNLPLIIQHGLKCDSILSDGEYINSGDTGIKLRRKAIPVPFGGCVSDYVPFYFAARSPMLYRQHARNIIKNENIIYLVSSVETIIYSCMEWCCSNMNAACNAASFCNTVEDIKTNVRWDYMESLRWDNTDEHPDRISYRMAEFLVRNNVPWEAIPYLAVFNNAASERVHKILPEGSKQLIFIREDMYF